VLVVIALSAFMVILDTTIVNVALPRIIQVFQTNVSTGQLILAGYMLALAVVVPASGYLSDRFGAKRTYLMTIILFTLGSALGGLDLDTTDNAIRGTLFLRGLAMGMVMMPATAVSMDAIPRHLIPRATALQNVLRQLFAAFGTGMFATVLTFRENLHQTRLMQDVTLTNIAAVRVLTATQAAMLERGMTEAGAYMNGLNTLMKQVTQTAKVQSFDDCFFIATLIALTGLLPALFLKREHKPAAE
jgi:MFS family permease